MLESIVSIIIVILGLAIVTINDSHSMKEAIKDFLNMTLLFTVYRFVIYKIFGV